MPTAGKPIARGGRTILFPASALGRKGAYELRAALSGLDAELVVAGGATEHDGAFWDGLKVRRLDGRMPERLAAVVLPAVVEHQPRALLRALAAGIPVIADPRLRPRRTRRRRYRPGARPRGFARGAGTGARRQHLGLVIIPPCHSGAPRSGEPGTHTLRRSSQPSPTGEVESSRKAQREGAFGGAVLACGDRPSSPLWGKPTRPKAEREGSRRASSALATGDSFQPQGPRPDGSLGPCPCG